MGKPKTKGTDGETMRVRLEWGTRYCDGDNQWHESGDVVDLPKAEAEALIQGRSAEAWNDEKQTAVDKRIEDAKKAAQPATSEKEG